MIPRHAHRVGHCALRKREWRDEFRVQYLADRSRLALRNQQPGPFGSSYGLFGPFEIASEADIQKQFATNLFGLFDVTRAVLPTMREQKSGVIVNVSSIGGLTTFPMYSLYHATKYAVVGFSELLNFELAPFDVRVKVVAPGFVSTDFAGRSLVRTFTDDS